MTAARPISPFMELIIELHSHCNRDCFFCPRHSDDSGHRKAGANKIRKSMSTENVHKILADAHRMGYKGWVTFHHLSEPFLDPRIIDVARRARRLGMRPFEHTNGDAIRDNHRLCEEAREVFNYLVVGMYDHTTVAQREATKNFWRTRLGDKVRFSAVDSMFMRAHYTEKNLDGYEETRGSRPVLKTYRNGVCKRPERRLMVHYTGNVVLCCEDMREEFDLGSAFEQPLEDIWYSEKHVAIVRDLRAGKRYKYPLCNSCPIAPEGERQC